MKSIIPWLHKASLLTIVLFCAIMFLSLGRDYLYDWDEGIYATIGREMSTSSHLLTPTWNGELWLEKPPLIGWVSTIGMRLLGETELGARLFMPIFACLTLYAIFRLGEKIGGTLMGAMSMALLGYFNLFIARARALNTDGILLAAITWTCWLVVSNAPAWVVGVIMGLGVMAKGASGILSILISLPFLLKKNRTYLKILILAFLITIVPWHLYQIIVNGYAFISPYFLEQVLRRATVPIEFHMESRWFYFNFISKDLGIGIIIVSIMGYLLLFKNWIKEKNNMNIFMIMWWAVIPLILFTLAKTRLSWYILPVYPSIALSIGYIIRQFAKEQKTKIVVTILSVGMLVQMMLHGYNYVEPNRIKSQLPDLLLVASSLSQYEGGSLAMLVSESERVAEAILPTSQSISSSFRYGGAPSVVWYSQKKVLYFYNYDKFRESASSNESITSIIVTLQDIDKVPPGYTTVFESGNYLGLVRSSGYAYH